MKLAIAGGAGRMGRALIDAVCADPDVELGAALEARGHPAVGAPVDGARDCVITDDVDAALRSVDALIDFTRPAGTIEHLDACVRAGRAIVIGTTGFSDDERAQIAAGARHVPVVASPNMAVGVNITFKLAELAARTLGDSFDVEIIEAHHRHKVDAPSGTALRLGEVIAHALGRRLGDVARHGRHGDTGERDARTIGFHAIRGGDIVGEHTALFAGPGERVEVTVRSSSRATYALGAIRAAKFLEGRPAGLYDMFDVLGLK